MSGAHFVPGVFGEAMHLGVDDRINSISSVGIRQDGPRTISVYLSFPKTPQGKWHPILGWGAGTQGKNFWLKTFHGNFMLWSSGHEMDWEVPLPVHENVWHHHLITYDGHVARWLTDDKEIGSGFRHAYTTVDTPLEIGGTEFSIDELAIFDRVLTPREIELLNTPPAPADAGSNDEAPAQ